MKVNRSKQAPPSRCPHCAGTVRVSWRLLALLALLLAVLGGGLFAMQHRHSVRPAPQEAAPRVFTTPTGHPDDPFRIQSMRGPWGNLELWPITLERPDMMLSNVAGYFQDRPWQFPGRSAANLIPLFSTPDLTDAQRQWLLDTNHWQLSHTGIVIAPPAELVEGLSPPARFRIYTALSLHPENIFQNTPFMFPIQEEKEWFANSGLSPATIKQVKRLCYQRGNLICFSDLSVVGRQLAEPEKLRLLKALSRVVAVFARLRVSPNSDLRALEDYWGRSGDPGDIQSLLDSVRRTPGGGTVDISYLLTDFARQRLFTYPRVIDPLARKKDCFWTALNYYNEAPDNRFLDVNFRFEYLKANYEPVTTEPVIGDVVLFLDSQGAAVHACVYIAAELLFTKNGATPFAPWVMMKSTDVLAYYSANGPLRVTYLRLKLPRQIG